MEFQSDGWVVKWAYLLSEGYPPRQTTLCELFWRCVLVTPVGSILCVALILLVCAGPSFVVAAFAHFVTGWEVALLVLMPIGLLLSLNLFSDDGRAQLCREVAWVASVPDFRDVREVRVVRNIAEVGSVIVGGLLAIKSRICPIVRIRDNDSRA